MNLNEERVFIKQQVDLEIQRYSNTPNPVTCGISCSFCCHVKVACFPEEIDDILSLGIDIDFKRLESQVNNWESSNKTCVFIKDNNCSIHNNKPLHCIVHLVNSPAVNCAEKSKVSPHSVISKSAYERLKILRNKNKNIILHEELYKKLS